MQTDCQLELIICECNQYEHKVVFCIPKAVYYINLFYIQLINNLYSKGPQ